MLFLLLGPQLPKLSRGDKRFKLKVESKKINLRSDILAIDTFARERIFHYKLSFGYRISVYYFREFKLCAAAILIAD